MTLSDFAHNLAHSCGIKVEYLPDDCVFSFDGIWRLNGHANYWHRVIKVPHFDLLGACDEECLSVWLHELGHCKSIWQPLLMRAKYSAHVAIIPTDNRLIELALQPNIYHRLSYVCEVDAWRWARRQFAFTPRMDVAAKQALSTYKGWLYVSPVAVQDVLASFEQPLDDSLIVR